MRSPLAAVGVVAATMLLGACTAATPAGPAGTSPSVTTPPATTTTAATTTASAAAGSFRGRWPVATQAQATDLQQAVDAGRQPWLLVPDEVAISYASAELGFTSPQVVRSSRGVVELREGASGRIVTVTLTQPVRQGPTGIWVVTTSR